MALIWASATFTTCEPSRAMELDASSTRATCTISFAFFVMRSPSHSGMTFIKDCARRPGLEPGTSGFRVRRATNCTSGESCGGLLTRDVEPDRRQDVIHRTRLL